MRCERKAATLEWRMELFHGRRRLRQRRVGEQYFENQLIEHRYRRSRRLPDLVRMFTGDLVLKDCILHIARFYCYLENVTGRYRSWIVIVIVDCGRLWRGVPGGLWC